MAEDIGNVSSHGLDRKEAEPQGRQTGPKGATVSVTSEEASPAPKAEAYHGAQQRPVQHDEAEAIGGPR